MGKCLGEELNEIEIFLRREDDRGPFAMERYEEEAEDSDNETDPEQLLNEWLGELDSLTVVSLYLSSALFFLVGHFTVKNPPSLTTCGQPDAPRNNRRLLY